MTKRQQILLQWLTKYGHEFNTTLELTTTATRELAASGDELDWLARRWSKPVGPVVPETTPTAGVVQPAPQQTETAASADAYAGTGPGPQNPSDEQEEPPMTDQEVPTDSHAGAGSVSQNNLPAIRAVAPELDGLARVGKWLAAAEKRNPNEDDRGAAAALRLYVARELGLSPLMGLKIGITERGTLILPAALYRDLAYGRGYRVVRLESTDETCTAVLIKQDTGEEVGRQTYTIERAKNAGLAKGDNWQKYPDRMLWHRTSKWVVEDFVPGLSFAISEDEAAEIANEPILDIDVEADEVPI